MAMSTRSLSSARHTLIVVVSTSLFASCGGGNSTPQPPPQYRVGGSVSGLSGSGLVLQDNGADDLPLTSNGSFVFSTPVKSGSAYAVTIKTQPTNPTQSCVLAGGTGTVTDANVTNVVVTCTTSQYTVGGSVGGLIGSGLVLQDNGADDLALTSNGSFVFSTPVKSGSAYAVTIKTQPTNPTQTCVLAGGTGTVTDANVTNVVATCTIQPGRFAYVSGANIYCFAVDAVTGALTALADSPCGGPGQQNGLAVDPSGTFAYATLDSGNQVTGYAINGSTGSLTAIAGSTLNGGGVNPLDITVDPSGHFVYMANYDGGISAFTRNSVTGGLTAVSGSPFPTAPNIDPHLYPGVDSVTVDPTGKFVYAAIAGGQDVSAFVIDSSTGALTTIPGSPFPASNFPTTVRVDPSGRYAYVANAAYNSISAYSINSSTGALTPIAGSPFPSGGADGGSGGLAVDPSGRFVYFTNGGVYSISVLSIDSSTGALTAISGSPFPSAPNPKGVFVHPSGKFLYVTLGGGAISAYTIDSSTGVLTPISGSPFAASGTDTSSAYVIAFSN
jgi:6-phosphogluconolactonase